MIKKHQPRAGIAGRRLFAVVLALALVCAFGLHDVQLSHTHYHGEGESHEQETLTITEYFHAMDRKLVIVIVSIFAFCLLHHTRTLEILRRRYAEEARRPFKFVREMRLPPRLFDSTVALFSQGVLHPRVYS